MNRRVLFAGASQEAADLVRELVAADGTSLVTCMNSSDAKEALRAEGAEVVIATETLPDDGGIGLLCFARERRPTAVRMLLLDEARAETLIEAVNSAEIFRFLVPPLSADGIRRHLLEAFVIGRVAEAQEAVWLAARRQQEAMEGLLSQGRPLSTRAYDGPIPESSTWGASSTSEIRRQPAGLKSDLAARLSARERQIVHLLSTGQRVKEAAVSMAISTHTVRNHLKAIYRKLNVRSQFELLSLATRS
jgi:DNA-binding CsgD family transcriptional regulator